MHNKGGKILKDSKEKRIKKITIIFICFLIVLLIMNRYSFAKYREEQKAIGVAMIAKPVVVINKGEQIKLNALKTSGVYIFSVRNYNEQNISEVDMKYYIEFLNYDPNKIKLDLTKNEQNVEILNNRTEEYLLKNSVKMEEQYKLNIKCLEILKSKNINQKVQIKINSRQV